MATAAMERPEARTGVRFTTAVPTVGAGAFVLAGVWYALIAAHVSVSAPPAPGGSLDAGLIRYYTWFATTLNQERLDTNTTAGGSVAAARARLTSKPVVSGSCTSSRSASGVRVEAATSAAAPSAASPTTSNPAPSSRRRASSRNPA